jgi:cobalamin biosynthesis Co2+ chelatase CbiK
MKLRILKGEAFEIVKGTLELLKDLFREVTVSRGVVLQVKRIKDHEVRVLQAIQLVE